MKLPQKVYVSNIEDGLGYILNDRKYIEPFENKVGNIVYKLNDVMYLTDYFNPEFIDVSNDYIRYGFLIVTLGNVTLI